MRDRQAVQLEKNKLTDDLNKKIAEADRQKKQTDDEIASLKRDLDKIQGELNSTKTQNAELVKRVSESEAVVKNANETNQKNSDLLKSTLDELDKHKTQQIKDQKEIKETTAYLREKMAVIDSLESEKKRLTEEKTQLQNRLDKLLQAGGKITAETTPVTPEKGIVKPARTVPSATREIGLKGLVNAVDVPNSMASVSLGSADGVRQGMIFHVIRGDEFICDILILDVDTEQSVGALQKVQQEPKVGDTAATNF